MANRARQLMLGVPSAVTAAGMIATPLARKGGAARRVLSSVVVGGLASTTAVASARRWSAWRAAVALAGVGTGTLMLERLGTRTGVPFGRYHYTAALRPQVGGVPAIVPLAWFAMAVPARETAHAALGRRSTRARRVVAGAAALTAWDLFLDPQMVGEGYWRWRRNGRYRGIPVSNFVGWFVAGLGVMAMLEATLPIAATDAPDSALVGEYGFMAVMETVGFAAFFRDRLVAAVGGIGMLPPTIAAARRILTATAGAAT